VLTGKYPDFIGGNIMAQPVHNVMFSKTGILSPTGSSKSFDAAADGYARYIHSCPGLTLF
jgi:Beta-ketoacyl synthase, N-terminal domain